MLNHVSFQEGLLVAAITEMQLKLLNEHFSPEEVLASLLQKLLGVLNSQTGFIRQLEYEPDTPVIERVWTFAGDISPVYKPLGHTIIAADEVVFEQANFSGQPFTPAELYPSTMADEPVYSEITDAGLLFVDLPLYSKNRVIGSCGLVLPPETEPVQLAKRLTFFTVSLSCMLQNMADLEEKKRLQRQNEELQQNLVTIESGFLRAFDTPPNTDLSVVTIARRLSSFLRTTHDVIWSARAEDFQILYINGACETLFGHPASAFYANTNMWLELVHPEDRPVVERNTAILLESGYVDSEYRIIHPSGQIKWALSRVWLVKNADGQIEGIEGLTTDITSYKFVAEELSITLEKERVLNHQLLVREEELSVSEAELRQINRKLLEHTQQLEKSEAALHNAEQLARIGHWEWNLQTNQHFWSTGMFSIYEIPADASGKAPEADEQYVHPEDLPELKKLVMDAIQHQHFADAEYRIITPNGNLKYLFARSKESEWNTEGKLIRMSGIVQDITERKQHEMALEKSERIFRETLENIDLMAVALDIRGKVTFCNDYVLKEIMGTNWFDRFVPAEWMVKEYFDRQIAADSFERSFENEILTRSGERRLIVWNNTAIRNGDNQITGTVSIGRDITEAKIAELKILEEKERLELAIQAADMGLWEWYVMSGKGVINDRWATMLGYQMNELSPSLALWQSMLHPEDYERVHAELNAHLSGRAPVFKAEQRMKSKTGEWRWILNIGKVIERSAAGEPVRVIGVHKDITDRKLAERKLQESEQQYRHLFDHNPIPMWIYDLETLQFLAVNKTAVLRYGYTMQEFLSMTIKDIRPSAEQTRLLNSITEGPADNGFQHSGEWKHLTKNGTLMDVEIISHGLEYKGRKARLVLAYDITVRKKAEAEVRKLALVAEKTDNAVIISDANGLTEWVNDGFTRITGFAPEEIIGKKPGDVLQGPETDPDLIAFMSECVRTAQPFKAELINYTKGGSRYWVRINAQPVFGEDGSLSRFIAIESDITERKQQEQQLFFQATILQNVKDSVIVTGPDNTIIYYNQGAEKIFGYSAEEMLGNTTIQLFPDQDVKQYRDLTSRLNRGFILDGEWKGRRKDGSTVWIDTRVTMMRDLHGNPVGLIGVSKDITDRKRAEENLRESESRLRSIFDSTIQSYFLLDREYRIISYNKAAENAIRAVFNCQVQPGDNMLSYSDPDAVDSFKKNIQRTFEGEKVLVTRKVTLAEKQSLWVEVQYLPAYNEHKEIYAVAFVSLDITQRKQTEMALLKSFQDVQNFKNALNASALISVTDLKGRIVEANPAFCEVSQYLREELIGQDHRIINSGYHSADFFADMWKTIRKGNYWRGEIRNKSKDGSYYWVDTVINPIFNEEGKITQYLSVRYLITERKKAEQEREKLILNLTEFAFMTAHHLRGPLARILGLISIFNPDDPTDETNLEVLEKIQFSAQELDEIIHRMIAVLNKNTLES
jgi:PAS domain S-box-containing protein